MAFRVRHSVVAATNPLTVEWKRLVNEVAFVIPDVQPTFSFELEIPLFSRKDL